MDSSVLRRLPWPDLVAVVLFVFIGRRSHDEGSAAADVALTAAPFLLGLGVAWALLLPRRDGWAVSTGALLALVTVAVGMVGRVLVGDGTALSFVIVATVFVTFSFTIWRSLAAGWRSQRDPAATS